MKIAGLSIEGDNLRALIISERLGVIKQLKKEDISLPGDEEARQRAITDLLTQWKHDFEINGFVIGVEFRHFSYHFVDLPVNSRPDIDRALSFEMEKYLPLPKDEYIYDIFTVGRSKTGTRNLVLAIRKEKLRWVEWCIDETKLKLLGIRCSGTEVLNEIITREHANDVTLLLKGHESHYLIRIKDKAPSAIKIINSDKNLSSEIEMLSATSGGVIYATDKEDFSHLDGLNIKVLSNSMSYLVAISAIKRRTINLDFTPVQFKSFSPGHFIYAVTSLIILSVLILFLTPSVAYYKDRAALNNVRGRIEDIKSTASSLVETKKELEAIDERLRFLHEFQKNRNRHINILEELSGLFPKDAWLENFHSDHEGKVEIEGFAKRAADIVAPLENSALFKNVEFTSPVTIREGKERFSIKMWAENE